MNQTVETVWAVTVEHRMDGLAIERARARGVYRTTFTPDQIRAIIASQEDTRDRLAVRLLLDVDQLAQTMQDVLGDDA
jgi:hypothetical protein